MQVLTDPGWLAVIIAAIGIIISVVVSFILYRKQQNKKEISYSVFDNVPLLNIKEAVRENFQVLYRGQSIPDATFLSILVWNSGNVPIEYSDYVSPFKLDIGVGTKIIFSVISTLPSDLLPQLDETREDNYFTFKPQLLNKGYMISVSAMVTGFSGTVKAEGLIKGVHIRNASLDSNPLPKYWKNIFFLSLAITSLSSIFGMIVVFDLFRPGYFINSTANLESQQSLYIFGFLLILLLSYIINVAIWWSPKFRVFKNKDDDTLVKHIFSLLPTETEVTQAIKEHKKH